MMPLIIVSKDKKAANNFVKGFIKEHKFSRDRIVEVSPLKNEIVISQIREIRKRTAISSSLPRLFIFHNFDKSTLEAQNAFLKTLEEGSAKDQFILLVTNEHLLLPTVRSRSTILKLAESISGNKFDEKQIKYLEKVESFGDYGFLAESTLINPSREEIVKLIEKIINYYRGKLVSDSKSAKIIKKALSLRALLERNNLSPQLTYDNLLIFIFKVFRMKI